MLRIARQAARRARRGFSPAVALALAFATASVHAELLIYEPFNYPDALVLDGVPTSGVNLAGNFTPLGALAAQKLVVSSPGLTYGNLLNAPSAQGNRANDDQGVITAGATVSVNPTIAVSPGDAIYFSALFTFDDSTNGNRHASVTLRDDGNGDEINFGEAVVGVRAIRVSATTAAAGELVAQGADDAFVNGSTLLLLGRYVNSAVANGDLLQLVGYDTAASIALPTAFDPADPQALFSYAVDDLNIDLTAVTSVSFTIRGDSNNFIDELRVGTTYADVVVPEPASASFAAAIAVIAAAWRRRGDPRGDSSTGWAAIAPTSSGPGAAVAR